jgi:hypothetical protein
VKCTYNAYKHKPLRRGAEAMYSDKSLAKSFHRRGDLMRAEIANRVSTPQEVDNKSRRLFAVFSNG